MFEWLMSVEMLERRLREWHVKDTVRILGESSRESNVEYADSMGLKELVEDVATNTTTELELFEESRRLVGRWPKVSDQEHQAKGLRLARGIAKAKGWRLQRNAEGYYKVE